MGLAMRLSRELGVHDQTTSDDAFESLFLSEYERVVAIARRVVVDEQEAEDVAQEVFLSFNRRHQPTAPYAAAWLHKAAAHLALNAVRSKRRRAHREEREALGNERLAGQDRPYLDPQRALELDEMRSDVRRALARLPEKSASVLILRHSGFSYGEIALALGTKVGQVGTMLRRAEVALRKEMNHETP